MSSSSFPLGAAVAGPLAGAIGLATYRFSDVPAIPKGGTGPSPLPF